MAEGFPDAEITAIDHNRVRLEQAKEVTKELKNVTLVCRTAVDFLKETEDKYDLIFIDSVKKEYPTLFYLAEKLLLPGGTIIFDDVFVYGYIFCEDCEIPDKFRPLAQIFREFLDRIKNTRQHSILPIGGGVLLVSRG
jgi:predicted O-methyltransferase YrrM